MVCVLAVTDLQILLSLSGFFGLENILQSRSLDSLAGMKQYVVRIFPW